MIAVLLLAFGLAMDAFSVSVSYGCCHREGTRLSAAFRLAISTGLFQFAMPLFGWLLGNMVEGFVVSYSKWIAFAIFSIIGIKMIVDALLKKEACSPVDISKGKHLIIISIATSIDAFIAGLTLGVLQIPLLVSTASIGIITFFLSFSGVYLGKLIGCYLEKWAEIIGGSILILLGLNALFGII